MAQYALTDLVKSLVRTYVPVLVGAVLTWLALHFHVVLPDNMKAGAATLAVAAVTAVYYGAARWLEQWGSTGLVGRIARVIGRVMLGGIVHQPTYSAPAAAPPPASAPVAAVQ